MLFDALKPRPNPHFPFVWTAADACRYDGGDGFELAADLLEVNGRWRWGATWAFRPQGHPEEIEEHVTKREGGTRDTRDSALAAATNWMRARLCEKCAVGIVDDYLRCGRGC